MAVARSRAQCWPPVDALVRSGLSGPGEGEWVSTKPWAPDGIEMKYLTPPGFDPRGSDRQHSGAGPAPGRSRRLVGPQVVGVVTRVGPLRDRGGGGARGESSPSRLRREGEQ